MTIKEVFDQYCQKKELPAPTGKDYKHLGRLTLAHFKRHWAPKQAEEVISKMHCTKQGSIVVFDYPEEFADEIINRIDFFLHLKTNRMLIEKQPGKYKKEQPIKAPRKRIPLRNPSSNNLNVPSKRSGL